jgi:polysaccharide export outer membrane protein
MNFPSVLFPLAVLVCAPTAYPQASAGVPANPDSAVNVSSSLPGDYVLGPNDKLTLVVEEFPDEFTVDRIFRIDGSGDITLPIVGRVHAGGLTSAQFEEELKARFSPILKEPKIVVDVTEYASQSVSVLGAVNTPGIKQTEGRRTLLEVLALGGGLRPDAGTVAKITRAADQGAIPLPGATVTPTGLSVATVRIKNAMTGSPENIVMLPGDTVFVPKADVVYAVGSLTTPGGFPIGENETLSALQVVALAQGLSTTAATDRAKILRLVPGTATRTEIPINLKQLMAGKGSDVSLQAEDILFVPNSSAKSAGLRTLDAIVNAATYAPILFRP